MSEFVLSLSRPWDKASATGEWRKGPKITKEDLLLGRGAVEKISVEEALECGGGRAPKAEYRGWQDTGPARINGPAKMGFGRYREKTMQWVKENDLQYWEWCLENVDWFKKKVEKAGSE